MKKFTALLLALAFTAILQSTAHAQVWVQVDATGCFDLQTGASCTLTPHDVPGTGDASGEIWTRDCDQTATEGFTCPFDWPIGAATFSSGGIRPVTLSARVNLNGNGLTTTAVCHEMEIICRTLPSNLATDTGLDGREVGEEVYWSTINGPGGETVNVTNTDDKGFLFKNFAVSISPDGAGSVRPGSRCELRYRRIPTGAGGCTDDTPADVGIERFTIEALP